MNKIARIRVEEKVAFHIAHHIPYTLEITGSRLIFKSMRGGYTSMDTEFQAKELAFIKSVKHHIIKNKVYEEIDNEFKEAGDKDKIKYFSYSNTYKSGDYIEGVTELDLKAAYWETANMIPNFLTPAIYKKGSEVSKLARLASIGTLAKKTIKIVYDGVKESDAGLTHSELTEFLWDTICYKVGQIMEQSKDISGNSFVFFWVDAIFVTGNQKDQIIELFRSLGYKTSVYKCEWVRFHDNKVIVKSKEKGKYVVRNGYKIWTDERPFPFNNGAAQKQLEKLAKII